MSPCALTPALQALMATGPSGDVDVRLCLSWGLTQILPVPPACRRQRDAPTPWMGQTGLQQPGLVNSAQELEDARRDGCREPGGAPGRARGESWGSQLLSAPLSPSLCLCRHAWNTRRENAPPCSSTMCRGAGAGDSSRQMGGLRTLLHFGYKCQGVKFAMPAPPSAGDFFFSPMLCCFSESGNASVLFT